MQDLCRRNLGWDEQIPEDALQRWQNWLSALPTLEEIVIDRCFVPAEFGEIATRELHHFSDASQVAYGAVSYLRTVSKEGDIHCSFLIGKSRLAPLKATTIPRLELSAAELDMKIERSVFWTDSTCVLKYIQNESRRFQTFVANRISKIHDTSKASQWNYVNTNLNPANDASRGLTADEILQNERWLKGLSFLWKSNEHWPSQDQITPEIPEAGRNGFNNILQ